MCTQMWILKSMEIKEIFTLLILREIKSIMQKQTLENLFSGSMNITSWWILMVQTVQILQNQ